MNKEYMRFLVSELIFIKDETTMHLIPKTEAEYNDIFADLEDIVDELNLNIRIIRRKLVLLKEHDMTYINNKVEKEFAGEIEENNLKKKKRIFSYPFSDISIEIKSACEDLYRSLISKYSPEFYDYPLENFQKIKDAFYSYDYVSLKDMDSEKTNLKLKITSKELSDLRDKLEIEIAGYYKSFPLNKISLLADDEAVLYNLEKLENIYNDYSNLYGSLEENLNLSIAKTLTY